MPFSLLVSRYPFPDHHAPPLSLIPMVVADMTAWLAEDSRNVIVIHCKAGKGRSGTLACCYLISLPKLPPPPQDPKNLSLSQPRDQEGSSGVSSNSSGLSQPRQVSGSTLRKKPSLALRARRSISGLRRKPGIEEDLVPALPPQASVMTPKTAPAAGTPNQQPPHEDHLCASSSMDHGMHALQEKLEAVFDFHTARRMRASSGGAAQSNGTQRRQVSDSPMASSVNVTRPTSTVCTPLRSGPPQLPTLRPMTPLRNNHEDSLGNTDDTLVTGKSRLPSSSSSSLVNADSRVAGSDSSLSGLSSESHGLAPTTQTSLAASSPPAPLVSNGDTSPLRKRASSFSPLGLSPVGKKSVANLRASNLTSAAMTSSQSASSIASSNGNYPRRSLYKADDLLPKSGTQSSLALSQQSGGGASFSKTSSELDGPAGKPKKFGVSIASQRRWVGYWARVLDRKDARATMEYRTASKPQRKIRLVRISILQGGDEEAARPYEGDQIDTPTNTKGSAVKALAKLDTFKVTLGRYDDALVERLESWERSARRRNRAFGHQDPSARSPELSPHGSPPLIHRNLALPPSAVPGEDAWDRLYKDADGKDRLTKADWERCSRENSAEAAKSRLAQHGNDQGVAEWGINVLAEADRVRNFAWPDGHIHDASQATRQFDFIDWFAKLKIKSEEKSSAALPEGPWQHWMLEDEDDKMKDVVTLSSDREVCVKLHLANKALNLLPDIAGGSVGWLWFIPAYEEPYEIKQAEQPNDSNGHTHGDNSSYFPAVNRSASFNSNQSTPLPPLGRSGGSMQNLPTLGSTGSSLDHGKTSSQGSRPPRHRPTVGDRTTLRFQADEIDFLKKTISGVQAVEVEWEWVDVGEEDSDDEE